GRNAQPGAAVPGARVPDPLRLMFARAWQRRREPRGSEKVPDGPVATADLAERARPRWEGKVVPHIQLDTLVFTLPEDEYPWRACVRVGRVGALAWDRVPPDDSDAFEFQLIRGLHLIAADRATDETAPAVLDAFLMQLTGT